MEVWGKGRGVGGKIYNIVSGQQLLKGKVSHCRFESAYLLGMLPCGHTSLQLRV